MLIDELKKANIEALKSHDGNARDILSVLLNKIKLAEIANRSTDKVLTDNDVVAILLKTEKELAEEQEGYVKVGNTARIEMIAKQAEVVKRFLPTLLTSQEIEDIIKALPDKSVPAVMKHFKANFSGKCDMKLVQEALKKINI
ncbi:MAG: GatB/YqeY domain-containing protein [Clostridia bacterium]